MESMQLDALFPEDHEGDEQDNQPRDHSDSASACGDAPRGNSNSGRQNNKDGATRAQSPHPMSQQNHSEGEGSSKKRRKCRHQKRYRPYAKNITVSIGMNDSKLI